MKRALLFALVALLGLAQAQLPFNESFTGTSAPGWTLGGYRIDNGNIVHRTAILTANGGGDPPGEGYLRLTDTDYGFEVGYAYYNTPLSLQNGLEVEFEYLTWGGGQGAHPGGVGADGITLFLSNAGVDFSPGRSGGGIGYCQGSSGQGLAGAYVGIAFDEYGNFANKKSNDLYLCTNNDQAPGRTPDAVTIRGPAPNYPYLTTSGTLNTHIEYPYPASSRPDATQYYRRAIVTIIPAGQSYKVTVRWKTSQNGTFQPIISDFLLPSTTIQNFRLGFISATGGARNYHEIRNVQVRLPAADVAVSKTGPSTVAPGGQITYTVTVTNNGYNSADGSTLNDIVPSSITNVTWACTATGGAACPSASGSGNNINLTIPTLPANGTVTFTVTGTVSPQAGATTLQNTANVTIPSNRSDPDPDNNTSTLSTRVSGYTLSGTVYHDLQPNGTRDGSDGATGLTLYVKRAIRAISTCLGPVPWVAQVNSDGTYSFTDVPPGDYCLILDNDNSDPNDTTPTLPPEWLHVSPPNGILYITQPSGNLVGQDFGLFHGGVVTGRVFYDNGEGGGSANNTIQDGGERGVPNLTVTASQGSNTRSTLTDASGNYTLWLPANLFSSGDLVISHAQNPATGSNVGGSNAILATGFNDSSARQRTLSYTQGQRYSGYNFGLVRESRLYPDGSRQTTSPGSVTYSHLFRPGTLGSVTLSVQQGGFNYLIRRDANCDGQYGGPGEDFQGVPTTFTVDSTWPREADGSFKACALELVVLVPAGKAQGTLDVALLSSSLVWASNQNVTDIRSLTDLTTVQTPSSLSLTKGVRNCGTNPNNCTGSFTTNISGKPGDVLEYCITYHNLGTQAVTQVVIHDPIPFFSLYVNGSLRLNGGTLTDSSDNDAGEVSGGLVEVRVGSVSAGGEGEVCYKVLIP